MSRSKPTDTSPNPAKKWYEWQGEKGVLRYYDKVRCENVLEPIPFTFLLLDQLSTIKGWHKESDSGIYANEVRDTRSEVFVVKAFKGGVLAEGFYKDIRDSVIAQGGHFASNCYIAVKENGDLALASIQFKGSALKEWMAFTGDKKNRKQLYKQAVRIKGFKEGKQGKVIFRTPMFELVSISAEADTQAMVLDGVLQDYLALYFGRPKQEQAVPAAEAPAQEEEPFPTAAPDDDEPF